MVDRVDIESIRDKSEAVLRSIGLTKKDASVLVDSMLAADKCGVTTHGIRMLPAYVEKIEKGDFSVEKPSIIKQLPSFSVIDAKNSIGSISAMYAVNIAIEQAKTNGIHSVFSRNSNTFGAAFYYAEKIADAGMIGFVCSNAPAAMPAYNGIEVMLGTNPLAFAAPTKTYGNVIMDMATSVVAKSRFGTAKEKGEKLGIGWALDKNGNPTTDPDEGIQGFVLPMAGFKGYGIAMMIDMLSGFISGAAYLNKVGKFYSQDGSRMNVGHMVVAFNPSIIYEGDYLKDADGYVECLKASKVTEGKKIIIPGEERRKRKQKSEKFGIEVAPEVIEKLDRLFAERLTKEGTS